jgi:glucose/mannose-6-phosphate isomerase
MNHNEIVGWKNPKGLSRNFAVVILRDKDDHPGNSRRMEITRDILRRANIRVMDVKSVGKTLLGRIFSLVYTGDFASYYLSILNAEDPTPVDRIAYLKEKLAGR